MNYVCPSKITELFYDEETKPEGRRQAVAWAKSLPLQLGDYIFLPDIGWVEKREGTA